MRASRAQRRVLFLRAQPPPFIKGQAIFLVRCGEGTKREGDTLTKSCIAESSPMGGLIYLVGLIVIILAILSFLGLH